MKKFTDGYIFTEVIVPVSRYYNKTATAKERAELFAVIAAGEHDKELSELIRHAWDSLELDEPTFSQAKTQRILNNILQAEEAKVPVARSGKGRSVMLWLRIASAAAILMFAGILVFQHNKNKTQSIKLSRTKPLQHDALPGSQKAVLTLANGKTIILDNTKNGTLAKQGTTVVSKTHNGQLVYNMAALAGTEASVALNIITTPRGGQYQVVLADGTKVWLNAASSLTFPTRFVGKSREVNITGEAYFEVAKNASMPFRVTTHRGLIEVLGTHFNIMAYDDETLMKTTLLEGAVNIKANNSISRLKPGEQAQIAADGDTKVVDGVDVEEAVAWKNGLFEFRDVQVDAILRQASRWYDVDVVYKGKIPDKEFTGSISRNVRASSLLNILRYTGIDLEINGNKIIVN